jgi:hypothetical protein
MIIYSLSRLQMGTRAHLGHLLFRANYAPAAADQPTLGI